MLKLLLSICIGICFNLANYAQPGELIRYKDYVFTNIITQKNQTYSVNIPSGTKTKYYRFDLYKPIDDTILYRPLIIWLHGGGFKFGSKKSKGIRLWSNSFARRGYVCAAVNYRLSKKNPLRNFNALVTGCYDAMQDVAQAIKFFKENAALLGIDTNRIILAGNSAGAIIALQTAYSNSAKPLEPGNNIDSNLRVKTYNANNIAAVINFWGALFDTSWLKNASVPIVSVHGQKDRIVPYKNNGSALYGSFIIHQSADFLKIPNRLKTYERYGHELQKHFIPILRSGATKRRWMEAGKFAADFLYSELSK